MSSNRLVGEPIARLSRLPDAMAQGISACVAAGSPLANDGARVRRQRHDVPGARRPRRPPGRWPRRRAGLPPAGRVPPTGSRPALPRRRRTPPTLLHRRGRLSAGVYLVRHGGHASGPRAPQAASHVRGKRRAAEVQADRSALLASLDYVDKECPCERRRTVGRVSATCQFFRVILTSILPRGSCGAFRQLVSAHGKGPRPEWSGALRVRVRVRPVDRSRGPVMRPGRVPGRRVRGRRWQCCRSSRGCWR